MINTIYGYVPFFKTETLTSTQPVQPNDLVFFSLTENQGVKQKKVSPCVISSAHINLTRRMLLRF